MRPSGRKRHLDAGYYVACPTGPRKRHSATSPSAVKRRQPCRVAAIVFGRMSVWREDATVCHGGWHKAEGKENGRGRRKPPEKRRSFSLPVPPRVSDHFATTVTTVTTVVLQSVLRLRLPCRGHVSARAVEKPFRKSRYSAGWCRLADDPGAGRRDQHSAWPCGVFFFGQRVRSMNGQKTRSP